MFILLSNRIVDMNRPGRNRDRVGQDKRMEDAGRDGQEVRANGISDSDMVGIPRLTDNDSGFYIDPQLAPTANGIRDGLERRGGSAREHMAARAYERNHVVVVQRLSRANADLVSGGDDGKGRIEDIVMD
jgi:hypothetical protein